jgi:hypothetical protein
VILPDSVAKKHGLAPIVDDYLYPKAFFRAVALAQAVLSAA